MKLRGRGIRKVDGFGMGDHIVTFKIQIPAYLHPAQIALLKAYAKTETDTPGTVAGINKTDDGKQQPNDQ